MSLLLTWNISHFVLVFLLLTLGRLTSTGLLLGVVSDAKLLQLNSGARGVHLNTQFSWATVGHRCWPSLIQNDWFENSESGKALR